MRLHLPLLCALLTGATLLPTTASASPWTLPADRLALSVDMSFSTADREFLPRKLSAANARYEGKRQLFPLGGEFSSASLRVQTRYGFTDKLEFELSAEIKQISYESDSVYLGITDDPNSVTVQEARNGIIDFDSTGTGLADIHLATRYNLLRKTSALLTIEGDLKLPGGYEAPQGTFSNLDPANGVFEVGDDVALGDGQIDARLSLLFGTYIPPTRTFGRAGVGYNHRMGTPGDQLVFDAKVGQFLSPKIVLFVGGRGALTLFDGEPIGQTFIDTTPSQGADTYSFDSVIIEDLRLDRDFVAAEGGIILSLGGIEFQIAHSRIVWGTNIAALATTSVSLVSTFDDVAGRFKAKE